MKILVLGTGAVGGYFGALLAHAGNDVVFVARGANLDALREHGLLIRSATGELHVDPVRATSDPRSSGRPDLVLVCVKSYDTRAAATLLEPIVDRRTIVVSLQNGIENEDVLASALGLPPLLSAVTYIGAEQVSPGVVRHDAEGRIAFGELDGQVSERARRLEEVLRAAHIDCRVSLRIGVAVWDKLAWNAAFNAVSAITRRTVGELLEGAEGRALVAAVMREVVEVGRARGVPLEAERIPATIEHSARAMGALRTSMLQDLERGRRLEHDALNGAVVRAAEGTGVAAPVNRTLYGLLALLDRSHPGG